MIEVDRLTKRFGGLKALDEVSFRVEEGQIVGLLGPNGAGKSTTMRILTGFLPGDGGTVRVAGHDVSADSMAVRRAVGYLPEGVPLYPEMRVEEYLRFRGRLKGLPRSCRRVRVSRAMEEAGVGDVSRRVVGALSRGYRQRVGLADVLLAEPRVLILDEPTVGLDPEQVRQMRDLLREIGRVRTILLSTHILSEVEILCAEVVIINRGRVVARDSASSLRRRYGGSERTVAEVSGPVEVVKAALEKDPRVARVAAVRAGEGYHRFTVDSAGGQDLREMVYRTVREGGWTLRDLRREAVSLEDAFVEIVGQGRE